MSWIPHFENWRYALGATALAIPLLLILYFLKLRRKEVAVSSTFLWKKAILDLQVNAPFQKLRRSLLLLLQLLLLLLLLLAFAQPVSNYRPGPGKTTVILIDRSASMNAKDVDGHSRLDEAKRLANELVSSMKRESSAMVIAFDDSAETIQAFTVDQAALHSAINSIKGTDRKTRLKLAYQLAEAQTNFNPEQLRSDQKDPPDVRLYSDGRALDSDEATLSKANLTFIKIGSEAPKNIAIVALNAKRNYERPTHVQVFAHLANFGPDPVDAPVQLSVDGEVVEVGGARTQDTLLLPNSWDPDRRNKWETDNPNRHPVDSVNFELDLPNAAVIKIEQMNKDGDMLAADDIAQVVVPPPKSLAVMVVTSGNSFLKDAIDSLDLKKPEIVSPPEFEAHPEKVSQFDVIIFDRYKPKNAPDSGNFIYFLDGPRAALPDKDDKGNDLMRLKIARDASGAPVMLKEPGILSWKYDHPILKDLALANLYIAEAVKLNVPLQDEPLYDALNGSLIVLDHSGKTTNLVFAFDPLQSDLPFRPSWPMMIDYSLQFLALGSNMDVRQSLPPGSTPTIPRSSLQKLGDVKEIKLKGPRGTVTVPVPANGDFVMPAMNDVGIYTTEPAIPLFEKMAVNLLDANESNLVPADQAPGNAAAPVEEQKTIRARLEWWWWLAAVLALPLLLVEWWVYTRRVHI